MEDRKAHRSTRRTGLAVGLVGALIAIFGTAPSASAEVETAPASPPIVGIPLPQIATEADDVSRTLRAIGKSVAPGPDSFGIEEQLPATIEAIDSQERAAGAMLELGASLDMLDELESKWSSLNVDLPEWRAVVTGRAQNVEAAIEQLDALREVWEATRDGVEGSGAPEAIERRVLDVLSEIAVKRRSAVEHRSALLTQQAAIAAQESRIDRALESLAAFRAQLVSRVFERNRAPIWAPEIRARLSDDLGARIREALTREREELRNFAREHGGAIVFHLALFAVVWGLLFMARQRVRHRTEEEAGLARVAEVFEFPISVALLLAIFVSPSIYAHIPRVVGQVLGAAALVPTVLILRHFTAAPMIPLLNALVVFYFLDRLREIATQLPTLSRLVFLGEMLGGVLFLGWLLRSARLAALPAGAARSRTLHVLGLAARAAFVLLSGALVADALGYSRLGLLVGSAALESAYVAVVAYAAVRVLDSLVTFVLRVRPLGGLGTVKRSRYAIAGRIHRIVVVAAVALWVLASLQLLAIRETTLDAALRMLTAELQMGSVSLSLGDIAAFVLTVWLAFLLSRFARFVLEEDVYPRLRLARGVPYAISTFAQYTILLIGFFMAVAATGVDLDRFALLAGAFGVGIGFGLQNVVNNFVSGLILLSERPVQVGDMIEAGSALGEVKRIGIRSSTVRTLNGAELIVPNAELVSERVINWTLSDRQRRLDLPVGVAYGTDRRRVLDLLLGVATANSDVLVDPEPVALFRGFGDSSLDFELRAWTTAGQRGEFVRVSSDLLVEISDALDAAGIEVPFPQRDLHLRTDDTRAAPDPSGGEDAEGSGQRVGATATPSTPSTGSTKA